MSGYQELIRFWWSSRSWCR